MHAVGTAEQAAASSAPASGWVQDYAHMQVQFVGITVHDPVARQRDCYEFVALMQGVLVRGRVQRSHASAATRILHWCSRREGYLQLMFFE